MKAPFKLQESHFSPETVAFLEEMLEKARRGEVLGHAGSWMYKDRRWSNEIKGEADRNPVFALGMVRVLDVQLAKKIVG